MLRKLARITLLLISLCLWSLNPTLYAANINVNSGGNLQAVLNGAANGDVITVQAGNYTITDTTIEHFFHIDKSITLKANGPVTLQAPSIPGTLGLAVRASNVVVQGFTINGGATGVNVASLSGVPINHVTLTSLTVNPDLSGPNYPGHGIYFSNTSFSTVDSCTVEQAYSNGIFLDQNSNNNLVMNNRVQNTTTQHALAVKNSNFNTLVNNTVTGSAFHGIILIGAAFNRVEKNSISGQQWDGIVVTLGDTPAAGESMVRQSFGNYIAKNFIVSNGLAARRTSGTGIWLNDASDGSYVFGNDVSGVVEAGITSFNSSKTTIKGNRVHGNGQAGLFLWNVDAYPRPSYTVIHNNYIYDNPANANILIRGAWYNDIAYNFLSGTNIPEPKNDGGISILSWQQSGGSTGNQVYSNVFKDLHVPNYIGPDTTATQFFQNRYINAPYSYSLQPADIKWDANVFIGGNYWSGTPVQGNPSTTPFTNFTIDAVGSMSSTAGPYLDKFPFQSENLGKAASITIQAPIAGQVAAAGSQKTIAWKSKGSVLVDIYYNSAATGRKVIASNYPDCGFYHWTLPDDLAPGTDYTIQVAGKNSSGALIGSSATSGTFTVGSDELLLLSPGPDLMANAGGVVRVGWEKADSMGGVNVYITSDGGPWTQLATNVAGDFFDVTLPPINSNKVQIKIQPSAGGNAKDAVDGYFTVRGSSPAFTSPNTSTGSILIGDVMDLEWISPQNSYLVDLYLWDGTAQLFRTIVANLPDRGKYTWFVPEYYMSGAYVRAVFRDASGTILAAANSAYINLRYTAATGSLIPFYRLYSDITKEHLYTTDQHEYNALGTLNWSQEGVVGQILNGPLTIDGVEAVPYYRLYDDRIRNHLWTTDRNEYFTLREFSCYHAEHIVGYVFKSSVAGTIPFNRLVFKFPPNYHLWTTDAYEVSVLTGGGWNFEAVAGYIFAQNTPPLTNNATMVSSLPATITSGLTVSLIGNGPAAPGNPAFPSTQTGSGDLYQLVFKFPPYYPLWTADVNEVAILTTNGWNLENVISGKSAALPQIAPVTPGNGLNENTPELKAVLNGASFLPGPIAPGMTVSLVGNGLGPADPLSQAFISGLPVPTDLGGMRVLFNGIDASVLYVSASELKTVVPYEMAGLTDLQVQVEYQGQISNVIGLKGAQSAPGVFTMGPSGTGQAGVMNEDQSINSAENPAPRDSIIMIYATGEGLTDPPLVSGTLPPVSDPPRPMLPVMVQIGGLPTEVISAATAPGVPGIMQVQVRIPQGAPPGNAVPITLSAGNTGSQPGVSLAIK